MDTAITQATNEVAAEQKASNEAVIDTPKVEAQEEAQNDSNEDNSKESEEIGSKPDEALTKEQLAKRERNRQSHLNSKLAQMRRENRELKARFEQAQKAPETPKQEAPKESDFENYGDYLKADAKYQIKQELAERDKVSKEATKSQAIDAYKQGRVQEIAGKTQEFVKQVPEYTELCSEYSDFLNNIPPEIEEAFLEAEDAPLALYALMKEGKIEELETMSPYKISMEIARAEIRGKSYLAPQRKVTNAPAPITAAKGNSSGGKPLHQQSPDELMKHFGFK